MCHGKKTVFILKTASSPLVRSKFKCWRNSVSLLFVLPKLCPYIHICFKNDLNKVGSFSRLCYHKCMVIFVTVLQKNGQIVNFTSEMAYSGLDLCMKLRQLLSVPASFVMQMYYPHPHTYLDSISMFALFLFLSSFKVQSLFQKRWEEPNKTECLDLEIM